MKLLVVEDEVSLQKSIYDYFAQNGNICENASDYETAYQKIALYEYDCIILDLMLPDGNGINLLKYLKSVQKADGVVIISARNALEDKIHGFDLGADDYLIKPFHLSELNARVTAVVRRKNQHISNTISFHEIGMDLMAKTVTVHSAEVYFTRKEYELLLYFITNKGKAVSRAAAAEHLWGDDADMADSFDFIYTHIKNIRKKITEAGGTDYFHSVYGVGYRLTDA